MKIVTAAEMRTIDQVTSEGFGVPSLSLMESAGTAVADFVLARYPQAHRIGIVCGKGNNGGDGFVAARKLRRAGRQVEVLLLADPSEIRGDAAAMFLKMGAPPVLARDVDELKADAAKSVLNAEVLIDAILGTGFRPPVGGLYADAITVLNSACVPIVAVDIPSGADAGAFAPATSFKCRADGVVTFTAPRPAHVFAGLTLGDTVVAPIGSPEEAIASELGLEVITPHEFAEFVALREPEGHKGTYGHALVIGGSFGKAGAAAMAGIAALRVGAGLSTTATPRSVLPMVAGFEASLMTEPLPETDDGTISPAALEYGRLDAIVAGKQVIALGPGISRQNETVQLVRAVVARYDAPTVIDADGLNAFEGCPELLDGRRRPLVLTPHPGEMSRLTGLSAKQIQQERITVAREFASQHHCIVVLKGHRTLAALPDGKVWVNCTGNPGMAAGGTGDVLTGMIAGLIAQAHSMSAPDALLRAVLAGVYLHGLAGDICAERLGQHSLIATDLLTALPEAFRRARASVGERIITIHP